MKRVFSCLLLCLCYLLSAQNSQNEVQFYIGDGDLTAYVVVDFNDESDDQSYVWGIRFSEENPINGEQMLQMIAHNEPEFQFEVSSGFLDRIAFHRHDSYLQPFDYWSLWYSTDGTNWSLGSWMMDDLRDNYWYGASYGFGMNVPGPTAPSEAIPAYSSQWFSSADLNSWIGSGSNRSVVVIDFGTTTLGIQDSFAIGVQYDGTINAAEVLTLIETTQSGFTYSMQNNEITSLQLGNYVHSSGNAKYYKGTNLSNWESHVDLSSINLQNGDWLGISFGLRRPFQPQQSDEILSSSGVDKSKLIYYPNPTKSNVYFETEDEIQQISLYNLVGNRLLIGKENSIDLTTFESGIYLVEVLSNSGKSVYKIIKE